MYSSGMRITLCIGRHRLYGRRVSFGGGGVLCDRDLHPLPRGRNETHCKNITLPKTLFVESKYDIKTSNYQQ